MRSSESVGSPAELVQLELLAQIDELVSRLQAWSSTRSPWISLQQARTLMRRLLQRVDPLRLRLEAPLVIATFGGTGVGKSSLVNALVGEDVAIVGRQRPTTKEPTVTAHPDTNLAALGLPLDELRVVTRDAPLLRDLVLIDCPDPDTSETNSAGSNLERLQRMLPYCDVLLYVSTQERYRSARVGIELAKAAEGCKLIFVQTHADCETDIRADWRQHLEPAYRIAEMFFIDSRAAFAEQQAGIRPTGDAGRLLDVLMRELSAAQRVRIRRGNLFGVVHAALERILSELRPDIDSVRRLEASLDEQRRALVARLAERLEDELTVSRGLWERRLMAQVTELWGLSPFSLVLKAYHSQASLLASWTMLRARSSAQMALWGAVHGTRWLATRQSESSDNLQFDRAAQTQLAAADLRESELIIEGFARAAKLDREEIAAALSESSRAAAVAEDEFWSFARTRLDELILQVARNNSHWGARALYEASYAVLPVWILARIGKNFFWDSWWLNQPLLETNFYIPAVLFLVLWTMAFLMLFSSRLRRGVAQQIRHLADELASTRLAGSLFPSLERRCREFDHDVSHLSELANLVSSVREQAHESTSLSTSRPRTSESV